MADEKISQLSDAGAPQDTDQLVIARSGSSLSLLFSALKAAIPGGVTSVFTRTGAVTAQTGDYTAAQVGALPSTETLDQIATANATAASVAMNSHKLTGLAAGSGNGDSLRYEQLISLYLLLTGGTMSGAIAMGAHKITGLTNGSASDDAAAFGQIPTALPPNGTAGGDLSGTYPNPAVAKITETSGPTDLTIGTINDGEFLKRSGSTLISGAASGSTDGWTASADTWTYASATTFTIAGVDRTTTYTTGTRLRLTQTTVKYFVVVSSTFSTNTTVTLTGGSDYTLANAAISANFYSYQENPQGYPGWFAYDCAPTGFSGTPTQRASKFAVAGRICVTIIDVTGTSNATTFTIALPIAPTSITSDGTIVPGFYAINAGGSSVNPGIGQCTSGTTLNLFKDHNFSAWQNSLTKQAYFTATYAI